MKIPYQPRLAVVFLHKSNSVPLIPSLVIRYLRSSILTSLGPDRAEYRSFSTVIPYPNNQVELPLGSWYVVFSGVVKNRQ